MAPVRNEATPPKAGDPSAWPFGRGPQGDAIRIYNFGRLMRDADTGADEKGE